MCDSDVHRRYYPEDKSYIQLTDLLVHYDLWKWTYLDTYEREFHLCGKRYILLGTSMVLVHFF